MKKDRSIATLAGKSPSRREWPQPSELSPIRTSTVAAATRGPSAGLAEPPVRPVPGWRLPSGQLLVEYALRAGLASSPLLVRLPLLGGSAANGQAVGTGEAVTTPSLAALAGKVGVRRAASPVPEKTGRTVKSAKQTRGGRA
jgi:hypothetical protein